MEIVAEMVAHPATPWVVLGLLLFFVVIPAARHGRRAERNGDGR